MWNVKNELCLNFPGTEATGFDPDRKCSTGKRSEMQVHNSLDDKTQDRSPESIEYQKDQTKDKPAIWLKLSV